MNCNESFHHKILDAHQMETNSIRPISSEEIEKIRSIPYLRASIYHDLDISSTLDFFIRRHIQPLSKSFDISKCIALDCGTGFGWFSIAYIMAGGKAAIAIDIDLKRLQAAREIAKILAVVNRMDFVLSPIQDIPLSNNAIDLFVSIETIEHIGRGKIEPALKRIGDVTSRGVLLTTPNLFFPAVAHDTRLPFLHWLPPNKRRKYARIFHREGMDEGNEFASPLDLRFLMKKFRPVSTCLQFLNFHDYLNQFPIYLPYGANESKRHIERPSRAQLSYIRTVATLLKSYSYWVMPNLAHLFISRSFGDKSI